MRRVVKSFIWASLSAALISCGGAPAPHTGEVLAARQAGPAAGAAVQASDYHDVIQQIFIAYFGRPADPGGLKYFQELFLRLGAPTTLDGIARVYGTHADLRLTIDAFGSSKESQDLYTGDDADFINAIYTNLFNRDADAGGKEYWASLLQKKAITRGNAAITIMLGAARTDAGIIANKTLAASLYTAAQDAVDPGKIKAGLDVAGITRQMLGKVGEKTPKTEIEAAVGATLDRLSGRVTLPGPIGVAAGVGFGLAVRADGKVYAWGAMPLPKDQTRTYKTPTQIEGVDGALDVATTQGAHFILRSDGTVWGWGVNSYGLLGGDVPDYVESPRPISGLSNVRAIAGSPYAQFMVVLKRDGTVWTWGYMQATVVGSGMRDHAMEPVQVQGVSDVVRIAASADLGVALKRDGTVWVVNGGTTVGLPVTTARQVAGIDDVADFDAGFDRYYAVKRDGRLYGWGRRALPSTVNNDIVARPTLISEVQNVRRIYAGFSSVVVLRNDGVHVGWGDSNVGLLGPDTVKQGAGVVEIPAFKGFGVIMSSVASAVGIDAAGRTVAWGINQGYALGDGTTTQRLSPVPIRLREPQVINSISFDGTNGSNFKVGDKITLSASVSSGLPPSFVSATPGNCTISGNILTGRAAGTCVVEARQDGDDTYGPALSRAQLAVSGTGATPGDSGATDTQLRACQAVTYPGDTSEPQVYLLDYQAQFDQCLYRATGNAVFANEGDAACATIDKLVRATTSTFRPMFCSGPRMIR